MKLFTNQLIASLGIAAAAAIAIGGTASSSGADATSCQTWHPQSTVADPNQQTLHPEYPLAVHQHTWNPPNAISGQHRHSWNPEHPIGGRHQHMWNPQPLADQEQHSWNPVGDHPDDCTLPSPTPPQIVSEEERASGA
ncbi:MAG: hypothetical protein AB7Q42_23480 [Acidimicrobiia bacterium]